MQRNKGSKKRTEADGPDNNVDGGEDSVIKDGKVESEDGSDAIKEKTKSVAKNNSKRRNYFTKNRQKKVSKSPEKDAASDENGQNDDAGSSPSKGKSVEEGTGSS